MYSQWHALGAQTLLQKLGFRNVTPDQARRAGDELKVNFRKYPVRQLEHGMETEFEHTKNPMEAARISMDHLKEHPKYYVELKKMEAKLKRTER